MKAPLTQYPGMNPFVLDWLGGDERFLPRAGRWSDGLRTNGTTGRGVQGESRQLLATALETSNQRWGIAAGDTLERWARSDARTIVAGQQVGFAGGPLYTLAKIATIVKMKRELEREGTPTAAFFWLATEDHDFDEVATLNVPARLLPASTTQQDLICMRATRGEASRAAVGSLPIPETLIGQYLQLLATPRPSWLREGISFRDSFAELLASAFGNEIILVDALLPELRRAGAPLFDTIEMNRGAIHEALGRRGAELKQAGYSEQVTPNEDGQYTLLYELDEHGDRQTPGAGRVPERTSTSALTRPLLQDFVLGPDVFVGGPAEVAYYAQIAPLHALLGVTMPRIALRGHLLVAPKRVVRAMERYAVQPSEAFAPADAILAQREPDGVARIREILRDGERELMERIAQVGELALPADHSLASSIQRSIGHLEFHFNKLGDRAIKGLVRKDRERRAAVQQIVATLHPDGHVQDRVVSWAACWHYGDALVERALDEIEPDQAFFKIAVL